MYTKYLIVILTFIFLPLFGQIKLEFYLIDSVAHVTIYNNSKNNYALPIDQYHFRPYEKDCDAFSDHEAEFPDFGLMLNVVDPDDKKEEYVIGYNKTDDSNSLAKEIQSKRDNLKQMVLTWGKTNNIKDYKLAFMNYRLMNNLIYLKPGEKTSFKIKLNLYNITAQELIFYNYILEKSKKYKLYLSLCRGKNVNQYLTSVQKRKLKEYKIYSGTLESNSIQFIP